MKKHTEISYLKGIGIIGLTYNKEKYANNVSRLIAARLHSFFPMYISRYDICTGMDALVNYLKLNAEPFAGALWFMFPFFWATLLYGVIYLVIYKLRLSEPGECIFSFVCCTLCSAVGFFYVGKEFFLNSFFDIALVGVSGPILVRMILKYMSK